MPNQHCPKPPLDHFKCYSGRFSAFTDRNVFLEDDFLSREVTVISPDRLCNPVSKNGGGIFDWGAHLEFYRVAPRKNPVSGTQVVVANQFGSQSLRIGRLDAIAIPTQKNNEEPPLALDHFTCYRVTGKKVRQRVLLADQFERRQAWVVEPWRLCGPVTKTDAGGQVTDVGDAKSRLVCYRLKSQTPRLHEVTLSNQFGHDTFAAKRAMELCVPSVTAATPPALAGISVTGTDVELRPDFQMDVTRYAIYPSEETSGVDVTVTTSHNHDTVIVNGEPTTSGTPVHLVGLADGQKIPVVVIDGSGRTSTYELVYVPTNFPRFDVSTLTSDVSEGVLYLTLNLGADNYVTIVDNFGVPFFIRSEPNRVVDFKLHQNGQRSYQTRTGTTTEWGRANNEVVVLAPDFSEIGRFQTAGLPTPTLTIS